ncbi:Cell wall synthesis protein kre9 precursor [Coniothyrium glycines]
MARLMLPVAALVAIAPMVSAGISFTSPKAGAALTAGTAITVQWEDGGTGPAITDLLTYELFLCAGGQKDTEQAVLIPITTQGSFAVGNTASGMVGATAGGKTDVDAYFLKMVAVGKTGGQLITFSDRFSYSGMTGVFPANVQTALTDISGTDGPATVDNTVASNPNAGAGAVPADSLYNVAYTMQTGPTRYAPMQPVPPKTITAKNTKPLYPTSSVKIATTRLPIPAIQTTITQSQTYLVSSRENTVAPAPHPTDDMQKFLNRWKD